MHGTPKLEQLLTCDELDVFDRKEISAFNRVHDLQQHSPSQQPSKDHLNHDRSRALNEEDRAYNRRYESERYAEEPRTRRYAMLPDLIEGRSPLSVVHNVIMTKPKPKIHRHNGPMPKEEVYNFMNRDYTR